MQWKDAVSALEKLAPTIAGIVGGPFAATGVSAIESALNLQPKSSMQDRQAQIAQAMAGMTPDQIIAVKSADNALKSTLVNGGVTLEQVAAADRQSARTMETTTRGYTAPILAWLVVIGAFVGEGYAMTQGIPTGSEIVVGRVLGTLDSALMLVLAFYFGSSAGSAAKNDLLAKALS